MKRTPLLRKTHMLRKTRLNPIRRKPRSGRFRGNDLSKLRWDCFMRDRGICLECGVMVADYLPEWHDRKFHMAHIKAKRIGGDSLDNVRTLCGRCHRNEHNAGGKPCPPKGMTA